MRTPQSRFGGLRWAAGAALLIAGLATAADHQPTREAIESDPYPLENCVVMQGLLPKHAYLVEVGGRDIRVCCENCVEDFRREAERYLRVVDERIKEEQGPFYPLETCVVDGVKLDESNRLDVVFRNRLFRVCSDECHKKLAQDGAKYFGLVNRAVIEKQKAGYPFDKCLVSGKPLGTQAVDHVVGNQLVRLADARQIDAFDQNAGEYLAKVRAALRKQPAK